VFGHRAGSQSAKLDELLLKGVTLAVAAKAVGSSEARVRMHIDHLKNDRDVTVTEKKGTFKAKK